MSDKEASIEFHLHNYLYDRLGSEGKQFRIGDFYDSTFKSDGLLTSSAFANGKLISRDDVRRVVQRLSKDNKLAVSGNSTELYFGLTDEGLLELEAQRSGSQDFSLSVDQVTEKRWARLLAVTIDHENAAEVSRLIDRSLDEIHKQQLPEPAT